MEEPKFRTQLNQEKVYILYADLKEYSAYKDNINLVIEMEDVLYEIGIKYFDERSHCFKVMGDGVLATDTDAYVLAEKALNIIEAVQDAFQEDDRFESKPKIRIALHLAYPEEMSERYLDFSMEGKAMQIFKDIAGEPVINAARIEPVVKPNYIFASKEFASEISADEDIGFESLGNYGLGKKHDKFEVELCSIFRKDAKPDKVMLQEHLGEKLGNREETYKNSSSLTNRFSHLSPESRKEKIDKAKQKHQLFLSKLKSFKKKKD